MSIEPDRDQFFQYATFGVIGVTLVVCLCYLLIFINPRANLITALQPPTPTVAVQALILPPTWTPTATNTPTNTPTITPTFTPTLVPTNTRVPTFTPVPARNPPYRPPGGNPPNPTAPPPAAASNTPIPAMAHHFIAIKGVKSRNCDEWSVSGTVWTTGEGDGFATGAGVALWQNGKIISVMQAGSGVFGNVSPGYYKIGLAKGASGSGKIGIVDGSGNPLSPQYDINVTKGCTSKTDVNEITVDFAYSS